MATRRTVARFLPHITTPKYHGVLARRTLHCCSTAAAARKHVVSTIPSSSRTWVCSTGQTGGNGTTQRRNHSNASDSGVQGTKVYSFEDVQSLSSSPSAERILIDVREPAEYSGGFIPSAQNVPISSQPHALFLPADEFEDKFGFAKPKAEQEVVFYCKAGVRSSAAAQLARQAGYQSVGEYRGSWLDWVKQGGKIEK